MKHFHKFVLCMLAFDLAVVLICLYWMLWPFHPVVFNTDTYKILNENKTVLRGEPLQFESNSCRNFIGEIEVHRAFIDGIIFNTPDVKFYQDKMECKKYRNAEVIVPRTLPPGKYRLKVQNIVHINPLRTISATVYTEEFQVW